MTDEQFSQLSALLYEYQEIFRGENEPLPISKLPSYKLQLTDDTPMRQKRYPLSSQHECVMEKIVNRTIQDNILVESKSPWDNLAILIRKSNFDPSKGEDINQYRICVDLRRLHSRLKTPEFIPLSSFEQAFHEIGEAKGRYSSMFDLCESFHQIPLCILY